VLDPDEGVQLLNSGQRRHAPKAENDGTERTLPLARLTAAIGELQAARDALDELLARKRLH
jgi:uncharacterized protein HemY